MSFRDLLVSAPEVLFFNLFIYRQTFHYPYYYRLINEKILFKKLVNL